MRFEFRKKPSLAPFDTVFVAFLPHAQHEFTAFGLSAPHDGCHALPVALTVARAPLVRFIHGAIQVPEVSLKPGVSVHVELHSPHVFSQYVFASLPILPALVQKPLALTCAQDIL